jgi:hypothetical protein
MVRILIIAGLQPVALQLFGVAINIWNVFGNRHRFNRVVGIVWLAVRNFLVWRTNDSDCGYWGHSDSS